MTHKFQKGDKVGVMIEFFDSYIPAVVKSTERNLLNVQTEKQTFTTTEDNVIPLKLLPRKEKKRYIYRVSERLK
jgi:hypothetical protein